MARRLSRADIRGALTTAKRNHLSAMARGELLSEVSRALAAAETDLPTLLQTIAQRVAEIVGDACAIRLLSEDGASLVPVAFEQIDESAPSPLSEIVAGAREILASPASGHDDSPTQNRMEEESAYIELGPDEGWGPFLAQYGPQSLLVAPLRARGETLGELVVARTEGDFPYDEGDRGLLEDLASRAALAIANGRLFVQLKRTEADLIAANEDLERRVAERTAELARSNRDLEQFAYVASHDLRTPLRTIHSFVQLLEMELGEQLNEETRQYMRYVVEGVADMDALVQGLLSYSRIGRRDVEAPVAVDADAMFDTVHRSLGAAITASAAVVERGELGTIWARPGRMKQVMQNLLENALQYAAPDRPARVRVTARTEGSGRVLSVADNGIGVPPEQRERVFQMFKRLHARGKFGGGTGLGLAVCRKIVALHDGRIWLEDNAPHGTVVQVFLPGPPPQAQG